MSRERDVNGKRLKRHRCQETAMTSENKKNNQERRVCVDRKGCQDPEMTKANCIKRKWHHQKRKAFQEIMQSTAVTARRKRAVKRRSFRLPLFFIGFPRLPPFGNFRHRSCPGCTGMGYVRYNGEIDVQGVMQRDAILVTTGYLACVLLVNSSLIRHRPK